MAATGCVGGVAVVGLAAPLAVGLAFLGDARRTGAFLAGFFLTTVVLLRVARLLIGAFFGLVLPLAFFFVANYSLRKLAKDLSSATPP